MRAAFRKSGCCLARRDVSSDDIDLRIFAGDELRHFHNALGVAVGGIDNDCVDACVSELLHARQITISARDGSGNSEPELIIAIVTGVGVFDDTGDIGEAVKPNHTTVAVNEREFPDLCLAHKLVGFFKGSVFRSCDWTRLHHILERHSVHRREAHVGRSDHSDKFIIGIENGEAVELKPHAALFRTKE